MFYPQNAEGNISESHRTIYINTTHIIRPQKNTK